MDPGPMIPPLTGHPDADCVLHGVEVAPVQFSVTVGGIISALIISLPTSMTILATKSSIVLNMIA